MPRSASTSKSENTRSRECNGEGAVFRRSDGRWEARIRLEGVGRQSVYAATEAGVRAKLKKLVRNHENGVLGISERLTVGQYLEH